jgi:acyl-CoA synthetase (AMP-forming)/AMP-acid ligase II/acyl carrier protein
MDDVLDRFPASNLVDVLELRAAEHPGKALYTFLPSDNERDAPVSWTYSEVQRRARTIAARLHESHLEGERALLVYPAGLEFVAAFLGCLYAGVIAVPVYPPNFAQTHRRIGGLEGILKDAAPAVALTTRELLGLIAATPELGFAIAPDRMIATDDLDAAYADRWARPGRLDGDTIAFLQYTSGSTGAPKGVVVGHRNLIANEQRIRGAFAFTDQDIMLGWLPLYHDMGLIGGALQPLYSGASCVLMSPLTFLKRPVRWLEAISQFRATVSGAPNFAYDLCARKSTPEQREKLDLSSWSVAFNGAEPVRAETIRRFSETFAGSGFRRSSFYPCYGLAEATLLVAAGRREGGPVVEGFDAAGLGDRRAVPTQGDAARKLVGTGRAMPGHETRIVDPDTFRPCETGQIGEIWLAGPSTTRGYWNQAELTAGTFHARVVGESDQRYLRTGDLGFVHNDELYVAGRLKDLIIIRGKNHYCQDIEQTVERCHPLIREGGVAAFSVEVEDGERLAIAAETRGASTSQGRDELILTIRAAVAREHELDLHTIALVRPGALPKTSSGKIRRSSSRAALQDGTWCAETTAVSDVESRRPVAPATPATDAFQGWLVQRVAAHILQDASHVDVHRAFMDYGVDSATAVQLIGEMEIHLGRRLPVTLLYEHSTIEAVSRHLFPGPRIEPADHGPTRAARRRAVRNKP